MILNQNLREIAESLEISQNVSKDEQIISFFTQFDGLLTNRWYSWSFFEIKVFKKGTMHLKFQNKEDWYILNKAYGKLKGFTLPEKFNPKSTKKETSQQTDFTCTDVNSQTELSYQLAS